MVHVRVRLISDVVERGGERGQLLSLNFSLSKNL